MAWKLFLVPLLQLETRLWASGNPTLSVIGRSHQHTFIYSNASGMVFRTQENLKVTFVIHKHFNSMRRKKAKTWSVIWFEHQTLGKSCLAIQKVGWRCFPQLHVNFWELETRGKYKDVKCVRFMYLGGNIKENFQKTWLQLDSPG